MSHENKAVVQRIIEAFNDGSLEVLNGIVAADFVGHNPLMPMDMQGVGSLTGFFAAIRAAMPDARHPGWTLIAEGDRVVAHMPIEGTFTHELMGIPPNGAKVAVWMANVFRLVDGKVMECWFNLDTLGFMRQLGVVPPMG
jgi:steroid delta-isomerase-like uncharacterized protein